MYSTVTATYYLEKRKLEHEAEDAICETRFAPLNLQFSFIMLDSFSTLINADLARLETAKQIDIL